MKKVIVFGFAHSGTSIVKSIISHIKDVKEIVDEQWQIFTPSTTHKYTICKHPFVEDIFFSSHYEDYIKIFIIRNPLFIYSSLNKRFRGKNWYLPMDNQFYGIKEYESAVERYLECQSKPYKDLYLIKYEDLFPNNYKCFKTLLTQIGFTYTPKIFINHYYENQVISSERFVKDQPLNTEHGKFRTWQINQPFRDMNDLSKLDLSREQYNSLTENSLILTLYPQLKQISYEQTKQRNN